jgi:hypothetical protein
MHQSEITFRIATQFHMLRHFEENSQEIIDLVLSKGYNEKQVSDSISLPGSRFIPSFAKDIPSLLAQVFTFGFEEIVGVNGNIVLSGKIPEGLFQNGIGNVGVVPINDLSNTQKEQVYFSKNRSCKLMHLKVSSHPFTNKFVIVLKKTINNYLLITGFPGSLAMPLPTSKMNPSLRKLSRAFWNEHVFLVKS